VGVPKQDLVGIWKDQDGNRKTIGVVPGDDEKLTFIGEFNDWQFQSYYPDTGRLFYTRRPRVEDIGQKRLPAWAKRRVVDQQLLKWRLHLRVTNLGDPCRLALDGRLYPGKVVVTGPTDPRTGEVLEGEVTAATGREGDEGPILVKPLRKVRYDLPALASWLTTQWEPGADTTVLGACANATMTEISGFFLDYGAMTDVGGLNDVIFRSFMFGLRGTTIINPKTFLERLGLNLFKKFISSELTKGGVPGEAFGGVLAKTLVQALTRGAPFPIKIILDKMATKAGEEITITAQERLEFNDYLKNQCRLKIKEFAPGRLTSKVVGAGTALIDTVTGESQFTLLIPERILPGTRERCRSVVISGQLGGLPEDDRGSLRAFNSPRVMMCHIAAAG